VPVRSLSAECLAPLCLPPPSPTEPAPRRAAPRGAEREGWGDAAQAVFAALTRADVMRFKEAQRKATAGAKAAALLVAKELLAQARNLSADSPTPPPPSRTKWTRLVHPSLLTGHVSLAQARDLSADSTVAP
jgi:hypothetical protein